MGLRIKMSFWIVTWTLLNLLSCKQQEVETSEKWKGQAPIQRVSTRTKPIQLQWKGVFDLGSGMYCTNDFAGGRLNGVMRSEDTIVAYITPENTPINFSPWYAFKLWSNEKQSVFVKMTYLEGNNHRYYPKISQDGIHWKAVEDEKYEAGTIVGAPDERQLPMSVMMQLEIGPDTLWVAAQELRTSKHNQAWVDQLAKQPFIDVMEVGKSRLGRSIPMMKIGEADDKNLIMVISRQHPPEVTGYLAMCSFVEMISSDQPIAVEFRKVFNTYVVPMVNPDGVDMGHWRHSSAGIDLNRDWQAFNQPETSAIRDFMKEKVAEGSTFYFAVDFHSTWEDIYYLLHESLTGPMPGLVSEMIEEMSANIEGLNPNIRPNASPKRTPTSSNFFYHEIGAESLTYELGDGTPRDLLKKKGDYSALSLMELMLEKIKNKQQ